MKYTIKQLVDSSERQKYLFFWGHQPSKNGEIIKSCFSQWWPCRFTEEGETYKSAEHYMMAKKALLFNDQEIFDKIIECESPAEAKKLGRKVKNFENEKWLDKRFEIVKQANMLKFSQNEDMLSFLLNTNNRVIVEASPVDAIWGIGMAEDHKNAEKPELWRGENLLGFALMEVRDELTKK